MLIVAIALVIVAATAAIVIRDVHPRPAKPPPDISEPATEAPPVVSEVPARGIDGGEPRSPLETDVDAPTQSMPAVAFGPHAAAAVPYPVTPEAVPEPEPAVQQPAAFVPAGTPYLQPDPDHLIQTEVVIEDPARQHNTALTKLVLGIAASGTAVGLVIVGAGRGIDSLIRWLVR